jgi:hypothetical protein
VPELIAPDRSAIGRARQNVDGAGFERRVQSLRGAAHCQVHLVTVVEITGGQDEGTCVLIVRFVMLPSAGPAANSGCLIAAWSSLALKQHTILRLVTPAGRVPVSTGSTRAPTDPSRPMMPPVIESLAAACTGPGRASPSRPSWFKAPENQGGWQFYRPPLPGLAS